MNCKNCNAELAENSKFCSNCGQPVEDTEETVIPAEEMPVEEMPVQQLSAGPEIEEEKKPKKLAIAIAAVVVVLAVLVAIIVGLGGEELFTGSDETAAPTAAPEAPEATEGTIPPNGNPEDVTCKGSYTASDEDVIAASDVVVATMGDRELTVGQLQIYYWSEVAYFLQDYASYAAYFGLDYTLPLDTQVCGIVDTGVTWQQYFLSCALDSWASYQSMTLEAEELGMELSDELRSELDNLPQALDETAVGYGLADAAELMLMNFGPAATIENYVRFWELYYTGYEYYNTQYDKLMPSADEVEAYYQEHEESYAEGNITKDGSKYVDVRHILLLPEGGTTDEETGETTYSEDEWEACRVKAQALLDQWLAGDATESSFAALATEHTQDPGSQATGGLYEDVYVGQMVEPFENWCFDEARKTGDSGLVRTEYGYHIMYFVDSDEIWFATAEIDLTNERVSALIPAAMEKHPYEVDYSAIQLGLLELG